MGARPPVTLTNPDKVLYPATGTTKADVFDYYTRIAPVLLPHLAGRPVTRKRWPDGVDHEPFFEKQLAASAPDWLPRGTLTHRAGPVDYPIVDTADALAWNTDRRFDVVCLTGAVAVVPARFLQWLRPGGRLFVVRGVSPVMEAVLHVNDVNGPRIESLFETDLPYLVGAAPAPQFVF